MTLEIEKVLVLSTAHVPQVVADLLDHDPDMGEDFPVVHFKWMYGWMVLTNAFSESVPVPPDLMRVLKFAADRGCKWVRFDCDAEKIPELPTWEW